MLNSFFRKQQHILMFMDIRLLLNSFPNRDVPIEWLWLKADDFVLHMPWILHLCRISPATSLQPDVGGEHYSCPVLVLFLSGKSCPVSVRCPRTNMSGFCSYFWKSCPLSGRTRTRKNCPYFRYPCPPGSNYKLLNSESMIKSRKVHGLMMKPNKQSCFCFPNRKVKTIVRISLGTQPYLMSCGIWMIWNTNQAFIQVRDGRTRTCIKRTLVFVHVRPNIKEHKYGIFKDYWIQTNT